MDRIGHEKDRERELENIISLCLNISFPTKKSLAEKVANNICRLSQYPMKFIPFLTLILLRDDEFRISTPVSLTPKSMIYSISLIAINQFNVIDVDTYGDIYLFF